MSTDYADISQSNGHKPGRPDDHWPQDVSFGPGSSDAFAHEWACWIFTHMRLDEINGVKPRPFSAWVGAAVLANREGSL